MKPICTRDLSPRRALAIMALVIGFWFVAGEAVAQQEGSADKKPNPQQKAEPKPKPPPSPAAEMPTEMRVFHARHVKAQDLAQTIRTIWGQRLGPQLSVAVDERSNSVIVMAGAGELALVETLVNKLDAASDADRSGNVIRILPLSHARADGGLVNALGLVLPKGSFQVDQLRNQVIVSGDPKTVEGAESFIRHLDTLQSKPKSPQVQVRLVWLASGSNDVRKPPEDMKAVITELAKLGIEEPCLVSQTSVAAQPDAQFRLEGLAGLGTPPYRLSVSGKLLGAPGELTNRLQISIQATQAAGPGAAGSNQIGRLDTEITAPPGQFVVLGMTPTETTTSVFVVQILPKK
jgi:hypothetical protein